MEYIKAATENRFTVIETDGCESVLLPVGT